MMNLKKSWSSCCLLVAMTGCFSDFDSFHWTRSQRLSSTATLIDYVDPLIGTGGVWWAAGHTAPAATVPFGMIKLGPDSSLLGKTISHSGFANNDPELVGFSLTRYSGTGVGEGGLLRVKPLTQAQDFSTLQKKRYVADKRTQLAKAGYYSVYLQSQRAKVELTASRRAGVHRYIFESANPHLVVELSSAAGGMLENVTISSLTATGFEGQGILKSGFSRRYGGLPVFFAAEVNRSILSHRFVQKDSISTATSFSYVGGVPTFLDLNLDASANQEILLKIGISYTSLAAAQAHLAEVSALGFEDVRLAAENAWQDVLSKIQVEGGSSEQKVIFYSALYRSFLMPTLFGDSDNGYYGGDGQVHTSPGHSYYSDFSIWDTFRTVHPLYSLIARDEQLDMMKSLLLIYDQTGYLTRWFSGAGHTGSMLGAPSVIALSEAYQKGITGFDLSKAMTAMKAALDPTIDTKGKECLSAYVEHGYCPAPLKGSVSYTLEYSYGDYALSLFEDLRSDAASAETHRNRARNALRKQFDSRFLAFLPRQSSGDFVDLGPKGPSWDDSSYLMLGDTGKAFVEGGARDWRFYNFYDTQTMSELFGKHLIPILDDTFNNTKPALGSIFPAYYWHGNEPGFNQAYMYALHGDLAKTQKWVHWILKNKYSARPDGLDGDDDAGTLSAWYVFSAMGFFPIAGTDRYVVGAPLFDRVTINVGGNTFHITKQSSNTTQVYLNGARLSQFEFRHADLIDGGQLSFGGNASL